MHKFVAVHPQGVLCTFGAAGAWQLKVSCLATVWYRSRLRLIHSKVYLCKCRGQGWRQGRATAPHRRHLAPPPVRGILASRRRKFGKITHENSIFQSFQPPCRKLQPLCRKISSANPGIGCQIHGNRFGNWYPYPKIILVTYSSCVAI